ncbi:MAG: zf-HC2 domain-containing protein, partial [Candidatus Dormibacteria bacterium]
MKCSLLTLSIFIDDELGEQRRSEVDAHLVGCPRCSAGAATLREEKARVGQLARVRVDPASAQAMLEQVGIAVDSLAPPSSAPAATPPPPADDQLPWQSGRSSAALPWTPRRPGAGAAGYGAVPVAAAAEVAADVPVAAAEIPADVPVAAAEVPADVPIAAAAEVQADLPLGGPSRTAWEAALPPPLEVATDTDASWRAPPDSVAPPEPSPPPAALEAPAPPVSTHPPPAVPSPAPAPSRVAAAAGPAALWTRVRDAVAVRLALARGAGAAEESMEIVSGAPKRRAAPLAAAPQLPAGGVEASPAAATASPPAEVEL